MRKIRDRLFNSLPWLLVIASCWWAVRPLMASGFFPTHDDVQVLRIEEVAKELRRGQFPVRWLSDLAFGFGFPLFNFYPPLVYYLGAAWVKLGFSPLVATKIMFGLGFILAALFMYLFAAQFWGKMGGFLAALFYTYAPYHAVEVYVRGTLPEFYTLVFLPLLFWGLFLIAQRKTLASVYLAAFGLFGLVTSHNVIAVLAAPFVFSYLALLWALHPKKETLILISFAFILGFGLSAFYTLPALFEKEFVQLGIYKVGYEDHFVYFPQLWDSPWGYGGSGPGVGGDYMSFEVGKIHLLLALVNLVGVVAWWRKKRLKSLVFIFFMGAFLFSAFLTLHGSSFFWKILPFFSFAQFPWRFLTLVSFFVSFLAGAAFCWLGKLPQWLRLGIFSLVVLAVFVLNASYFRPSRIVTFYRSSFRDPTNTTTWAGEYTPIWVKEKPTRAPTAKIEVVQGEIEVGQTVPNPLAYSFKAAAGRESLLKFNTYYFPGWQVKIDGKKTPIDYNNLRGVIRFPVSKGSHEILIYFLNTPIRKAGNGISAISWLIFLGGLGKALSLAKHV